ncbi:MAG: ammonia-forming cytochrome c nitrite reductase subunit c552 [Acidobacteria bacterium]|nr:ammonia-forming cytochrome c nitrite reductase subunit c552 [Acidobacteriota bacterium]
MTKAAGSCALIAALFVCGCQRKADVPHKTTSSASSAAGSSECKTCHPAFYKKWATSHHGLAMQPYTAAFAKAALSPQTEGIKVQNAVYRAFLEQGAGYMEERTSAGTKRLQIAHVMGGKNTYYLLTPLERGRLQVLPLAYDVNTKRWYDMAASGVRMHAEGPMDRPVSWMDPGYTFNTSCYSCHVSQLQVNYNLASDTYNTTWREPGISCEVCHGDAGEHVALYKRDLQAKHTDMKIIRTTQMSTAQRNELCAPCHAKTSPISPTYQVKQRFFDHYDLVTLESADFYPDGRDLGENYTYTSWLMSPCARSGKIDCVYCHTSSGRYRFATENQNGACSGCHPAHAANPEAHTHHKPGAPGGRCIDCHMPKTRFANMNRSDHSMLPPTPALTARYKSPNACNLCHKDKPASWADAKVRQWRTRDFQKPVLERAALVDAARQSRWETLPAIIAYLDNPSGDAVTQASLIRLLRACPDPRRTPALIAALKHPNPLIRAAAASSIAGAVTSELRDALAAATSDEFRIVRIRAAGSLAGVPLEALPAAAQQSVQKAVEELIASYQARPDDFLSHTNLGNFYMDRGQLDKAIPAFEVAVRLRPDSVGSLVNASIAYSRAGRTADAESALERALKESPANAPANFNRGLLFAEQGKTAEAEKALRIALKSDPQLAPAAYNLGILLLARKDRSGLEFCGKAAKAQPWNEKYVYSYAFYLDQAGQSAAALRTIEPFCATSSASLDAQMLLAALYAKNGRKKDATQLYTSIATLNLRPDQRAYVRNQLRALQQ